MIFVAGGGLAGAATATALAQAGRAVTLIERDTVPKHKICGEFLSVEAQADLRRLGFDVRGHEISHVRLIMGARAVRAALPFTGLSVTRRGLDFALRAHAAQAGAVVWEDTIRAVQGGALELAQRGRVAGEALFLATGKHELRGAPRPAAEGRSLVGFKMYFHLAPAQRALLAGHAELYAFAGGYAGLQLVETEEANLCLLIERDGLKRLGGGWAAVLDDIQSQSPLLAARLAGAVPALVAPLTIARIPYGYVFRGDPGGQIYRLGDQAGVIPSFTGDGMAIALHSARLAAGTYLAGGTAGQYQQLLARQISGQIARASALHGLVRHGASRAAFFAAARLFPGILPLMARLTRVPGAARLS